METEFMTSMTDDVNGTKAGDGSRTSGGHNLSLLETLIALAMLVGLGYLFISTQARFAERCRENPTACAAATHKLSGALMNIPT